MIIIRESELPSRPVRYFTWLVSVMLQAVLSLVLKELLHDYCQTVCK